MIDRPLELLTDEQRRIVETTPEDGFIPEFEGWAAMKTDASKYALKAAAITALSLAAGDVVVLPSFFGAEPIYMNTYIMLVGPSTVMRKTTVLGYVKDLLPVNEQNGQGFVKFMDDVSIQAFNRQLAESGRTQSPVLLALDEVAGLFQQVRNRSGHFLTGFDKSLLKAYDHSAVHISRVGRDIDAEHGAFVNVFAATTPEPLLEVLDGDDIESGLLPRFIIFDVRDAQRGERIPLGQRLDRHEEWEEKKRELQAHLARIAESRASGVPTDVVDGVPKFPVTTMRFSPRALELLDSLDQRFNREIAHDTSAAGAIKGRAFWHIAKLSGLYALSRGGKEAEILEIDVLRAMWLMEETVGDLLRMKEEVGANVLERRIKQVETILKTSHGKVKMTTIMRRLKLNGFETKDLLATLAYRGLINQSKDGDGAIWWEWAG